MLLTLGSEMTIFINYLRFEMLGQNLEIITTVLLEIIVKIIRTLAQLKIRATMS